MAFPILVEDESIVVINKPPSIVVNRAESVKTPTVQDWSETIIDRTSVLRDESLIKKVHSLPDLPRDYDPVREFVGRGGIVHRIDKETSGILIIAKTVEAFLTLQSYFREREIGKTYTALVHGALTPARGIVNVPVGRLPWNKEQFGVVPGGKESITEYEGGELRVLGADVPGAGNAFSVVVLHPKTGRTHQIRVHMKYLGHPLIGDYLYAGRKTSRDDRVWAPRVMLHATKIHFPHPVTKHEISLEAPLPEDMQSLIDRSTVASSSGVR